MKNSPHGTTTRETIFKEVEKILIQYNLKLSRIDVLHLMMVPICVEQKSWTASIYKAFDNVRHLNPVANIYYVLLNQQCQQ